MSSSFNISSQQKGRIPFASDRLLGVNYIRVPERSHRILRESHSEHPQYGDRYDDTKLSTFRSEDGDKHPKFQCRSADLGP